MEKMFFPGEDKKYKIWESRSITQTTYKNTSS